MPPARPSFRRLAASPLVTAVSPARGLPGTVLTVTGSGFGAGFNATGHLWGSASAAATQARLAADLAANHGLSVNIAGEPCRLLTATDAKLTCRVPLTASGVAPVRVSTALGAAGPGRLPVFVVEHVITSISPSAGSVGGGQTVTVTGANLPPLAPAAKFELAFLSSINGTNFTSVTPCAVVTSNYSALTVGA